MYISSQSLCPFVVIEEQTELPPSSFLGASANLQCLRPNRKSVRFGVNQILEELF